MSILAQAFDLEVTDVDKILQRGREISSLICDLEMSFVGSYLICYPFLHTLFVNLLR